MHCISFLKVLLKYNTIYSPIVNAACGVVYPLVGRPSSPILEEILYSSHTQDEEDRYHGYLLAKRTYFRHPIQQDNENEIQVGHTMELLQQILRYEREQRILRCPYLVANKLTIGMIPLWGLRWHCVIGNHRSIASLFELVAGVVIAQGKAFPPGRCLCPPECVYRLGSRCLPRMATPTGRWCGRRGFPCRFLLVTRWKNEIRLGAHATVTSARGRSTSGWWVCDLSLRKGSLVALHGRLNGSPIGSNNGSSAMANWAGMTTRWSCHRHSGNALSSSTRCATYDRIAAWKDIRTLRLSRTHGHTAQTRRRCHHQAGGGRAGTGIRNSRWQCVPGQIGRCGALLLHY